MFSWFKFLAAVILAVWLIWRGFEQSGYHWQWYRIPEYFYTVDDGKITAGPLLQGMKVTFQISALSLVLSFIFGLGTALLRLSESFISRLIARVYLELVRNTPLLVQLFFIYFVLGPIFDIDRFMSAVLALSLFEGAYASEIFRAGIVSIAKGQWEAAYSLGLTTAQTYRHIILPQAIPRMLPALVNQGVSLIKDSALVSTIAVYDLTMQGQIIISNTFLTFEIWFTVAAIYLVITATLSLIVNRLEKRLKVNRY
ncbi:MAG: polar amino acid ABC transporter permease [Desulfobacteraceae bacterium IS3]|nr:MAG: polar amino acid ABC transporter permease [Desulfobacteraceae bacterium IS3]